MGKPRYALQTDGNETEIVKALEAIGCAVIVIGRPVDLLVGYRKHNFLIEVKNPDTEYGAKDRSTPTQREFFKAWPGQVRKLYTAEEAIKLVTRAYRGAQS